MSNAALKKLRGTKISVDDKYELYAQYLEDKERFSEATALDKMDTAITDLMEEVNVANSTG